MQKKNLEEYSKENYLKKIKLNFISNFFKIFIKILQKKILTKKGIFTHNVRKVIAAKICDEYRKRQRKRNQCSGDFGGLSILEGHHPQIFV